MAAFGRIAVVQPARSGLPFLNVRFTQKRSLNQVEITEIERLLSANSSRSTSSSKGLFELHHPECLLEAVAYKELLSTRVF